MIRQLRPVRTRVPEHLVREMLFAAIAELGRARARQAAPAWAVRGFATGVVVVCAARLAAFLGAVPDSRVAIVAAPFILALIATGIAVARRIPSERVAREVDHRRRLGARVATALEIERHGLDGPLASLQRADAVAHLRQIDPADVFPMRLSRRDGIALAVAVVALCLVTIVPSQTANDDRSSRVSDVILAAAQDLELLADDYAAAEALPEETRTEIASALNDAAAGLEEGVDAPERALAALSEAERELAAEQDRHAADRELALARLADALTETSAGSEVAKALDAHDYAAAAEELRQLGREARQLAPGDQQALANALQQAANTTARVDPQLSQRLAEASTTLGRDGGEEAMNRAADEVQQAGAQVQSQRAREQALAAMQRAQQAIRNGEQLADTGASGQGTRAESGMGGSPESAQADGASMGGEQGSAAPGGLSDASPGEGSQPGTGNSGAGQGTLENRGESEDLDFRSRQVWVPSRDFERPQIMPGQQLAESEDGQAVVDYRQVVTEYRQRATEALAAQYVPPALKELVRDYFSSLDTSE